MKNILFVMTLFMCLSISTFAGKKNYTHKKSIVLLDSYNIINSSLKHIMDSIETKDPVGEYALVFQKISNETYVIFVNVAGFCDIKESYTEKDGYHLLGYTHVKTNNYYILNVTNNPADLKKIIKKKKKKKKMRYFAKIESVEDGAFLILNENIAFKLVNNPFVQLTNR